MSVTHFILLSKETVRLMTKATGRPASLRWDILNLRTEAGSATTQLTLYLELYGISDYTAHLRRAQTQVPRTHTTQQPIKLSELKTFTLWQLATQNPSDIDSSIYSHLCPHITGWYWWPSNIPNRFGTTEAALDQSERAWQLSPALFKERRSTN